MDRAYGLWEGRVGPVHKTCPTLPQRLRTGPVRGPVDKRLFDHVTAPVDRPCGRAYGAYGKIGQGLQQASPRVEGRLSLEHFYTMILNPYTDVAIANPCWQCGTHGCSNQLPRVAAVMKPLTSCVELNKVHPRLELRRKTCLKAKGPVL